jgi:hypothetical protein
MFGVSLDGPQPVIVLEYCSGGIKSNQIKSNYKLIFIVHLIVRRKSRFQQIYTHNKHSLSHSLKNV